MWYANVPQSSLLCPTHMSTVHLGAELHEYATLQLMMVVD